MKKLMAIFALLFMVSSVFADAEIYVMRHGDYGGKDKSLTAKGKIQINDMLKQLKLEKIDSIMCSSIKRAKQSAEVIKEYYDGKIDVTESEKLNYKISKDEEINDLIEDVRKKNANDKKIIFMVTHTPEIKKVIDKYKLNITGIGNAEVIQIKTEGDEVKAKHIKIEIKKEKEHN